jgi:predicted DCC family thiol-disulfide oxidoreductase YuxK
LIRVNAHSRRPVLAFDRDCGPCTKFSKIVSRLDIFDKIELMPIAAAEKQGLLDSIPPSLHYDSFHMILGDGQVKSGPDGVLQLIAILPMGRLTHPIIDHMPGGKQIVRFVYHKLAKLRSGSCSVNGGSDHQSGASDSRAP